MKILICYMYAQRVQYYDRILRLKRYFEEERHSHNFLITHENTNNSKDLVFPFTDDQEFAVLRNTLFQCKY